MSKSLHGLSGITALLTILIFWVATILVETMGDTASIVTVKTLIPWGLLLLIPALMVTGASGFVLAREHGGTLVHDKRRRMPLIAGNGLLILVPSALFLADKAGRGELDGVFYAVQSVELVAGAVNMALLALNVRDGSRCRRSRIVMGG